MSKNYKTLKAYRKAFEKQAALNFYNSFLNVFVTYFYGVIGMKEATEIISRTKEISISQTYAEIKELEKLGIIRKIKYGNNKILIARNYLLRNILGKNQSIKNKNYKYQLSNLKFKFMKDTGFLNLSNYHINLQNIISYKNFFPKNDEIKRSLKGHEIYIADYQVKKLNDLELETIYYICFLSEKITKRGVLKKIDLLESISNSILKVHKSYPKGYSKYNVTFLAQTDFNGLNLNSKKNYNCRGEYKFKTIR